jgi:hypothetical protein
MDFIFFLIKMPFIIVLGVVYLPLNMLLMKFGPFVHSFQRRDPALYYVLYIPFGLLWIITTILSKPYEALVESAH